jgi:hypothetical protein
MNEKIIRYRIEVATTVEELQAKVTAQILQGWQPFGNLISEDVFIIQPMVIYQN